MAHTLRFEQAELPERALPHGIDGDPLRIVSVYNQIEQSGFFDVTKPKDQDEILAEFWDRDTFVARSESDNLIRGVALYAPRTEPYVSEIIGLAVDHPYRGEGIGSFLVAHLVMVAKDTDREAIEVVALESAHEFWQHKGFEPIEPHPGTSKLTRMRLKL